ncbi:MAG: DNA methyltransferase [Actinomycetota bacterium]|nr:DNA methyltransferase [Actinomycetota bacterium]
MEQTTTRRRPGEVRDAILATMSLQADAMHSKDIADEVAMLIGETSRSSVRSYIQLNTPSTFVREARGVYRLREELRLPLDEHDGSARPLARSGKAEFETFKTGEAELVHANCLDWLESRERNSIHAVVTDPPYGLHEYTDEQLAKLRAGKGGVWRIPPSFDGHARAPLPRFTTLTSAQLEELDRFFYEWARALLPALVPGANVVVASNPLLSYIIAASLARAGLERRGELIRLVMTMRGGDRPKDAHEEFDGVSVMPRSMWEPWLLFRKPLDGTVRDNLRRWGTGGYRRPSDERPFGDVIKSSPTQKRERELAPHPSLKPQAFMREVVRGVLPLGKGVVLDPFAGSGSTLAAAEAVGYRSLGVERDARYFKVAQTSIHKLAALEIRASEQL